MAEPHTNTTIPRRRLAPNEKRVPTIVMILAFLFVAGIGYVAGVANNAFTANLRTLVGGKELDLSLVQETYDELQSNFDGDLDEQALVEGASKGLVEAAGDRYTVFMNSKESNSFDDALTGNIGGGVGIEIAMRGDSDIPTVVRVLLDNPAEKAGVAADDSFIEINGESTEDMTLNDVVEKIRGEEGTTVKLTVIRGGVEKEFNITRQQVNNPSAYGEVKDGVGILTITRFDDNTGSLARTVAKDFKKQGVKGVVLDLRGNGGGYVTAAQAVAGIWLDNKLVTTERSGGKVTDELKSTGNPILNGVKTVVLVNESSASASEIVAGALRDHKVATIMGETSFGKGSVQKLVNLSGGATLKVTIARWYTPSGATISEKGITPDITIDRSPEDIDAGRDPQLNAAIASF